MEPPVKRKLATILAADVQGYSRLMGRDEEGTLRTLAEHRTVMDAIIARFHGRIANTAGDSVLAEFESPVEGVRAAVEIQEALGARNASLPADRRMQFRIGVNLGDIMVKDGDLLGDGVNIAARLQSIAEPGGVFISGTVFDQVDGKLNLGLVSIGEQHVKNIAKPVRAYRIDTHGAAAAPAGNAAPNEAPLSPKRRWPVVLAAAGLVVAVATGAAWWRLGHTPGSPSAVTAADFEAGLADCPGFAKLDSFAAADDSDGSQILVLVRLCDELGNDRKRGLQVIYLLGNALYYATYEPNSVARLVNGAGPGAVLDRDQSWIGDETQYLHNTLLPGAPPQLRVDVKTRSMAAPLSKTYPLPFEMPQ
jgi:class 3 adenylate cyclase